ncbi:uncharacterized protein LOC108666732 [Hyalella azteca]|uniref:Uncharacterized protein LOC108666732 n=1 Tax=Hyalella azteca TaxID=294128 RepID=A0A8B7N781_HYAAZ|nr:uncharacterized protein LOC108666732 [Hyalella azteca]
MKYDPKVTEFSFAIGMDNFVTYEPGLSSMKCKPIISTGKAFTYKNKFLGQGPLTDNTQATPGEIPVATVISSMSSKREAITKPMLQPNLCLYEVVSMLKCCSCNAVFHDMTSLLHHYQTTHLADSEGPPVCIRVSTADKKTLHQCNQRTVVCHKCGSTIPASTLEGFASKVNIPACKENNISEANLSPANNPFYETASSSSFPSSMNLLDSVDTPGSERAGDNFITTAADCSALDERSPSPDPINHHHPTEGFQDSSCPDTAISFLDESYLNNKYVARDLVNTSTLANSSTSADVLFVNSTSSSGQVEDNSTDGSSVFSEDDDDVSGHSEGKKDAGNDCATQVYVLDVLGGTDMEDVSQSNDAELLEQPPRRHLKLTGNPAPPPLVPKKPKIHKFVACSWRLLPSMSTVCS